MATKHKTKSKVGYFKTDKLGNPLFPGDKILAAGVVQTYGWHGNYKPRLTVITFCRWIDQKGYFYAKNGWAPYYCKQVVKIAGLHEDHETKDGYYCDCMGW